MKTKQEKNMLTPFLAKSFDHIRCDERGNILSLHNEYMYERSKDAGKPVYEPTFFLNGEAIYKGPYFYFDLQNGNYAISRKENDDEVGIWINGYKSYSLKRSNLISQGGLIKRENGTMSAYWRLLNGKLLTSENGNLLYDGNLLLKKGLWDLAKIFGDSIFGYRLFVSQSHKCFEIDLSTGNLIPIDCHGLRYIRYSQGKLLTFSEGKFFVEKEPFFDLEKYLCELAKQGQTSVLNSFDYSNGILALVFNTPKSRFKMFWQPFTIHLSDRNGNIIDKKEVSTPLLVNGKIVEVNDDYCMYGNCRYDFEIEYPEKIYDNQVINNHLFVSSGYNQYYKVNLPE